MEILETGGFSATDGITFSIECSGACCEASDRATILRLSCMACVANALQKLIDSAESVGNVWAALTGGGSGLGTMTLNITSRNSVMRAGIREGGMG